MFPFIYYIDCEGNLWVPCSCRCNGAAAGSATLPQVRYTDCEKKPYECIRPASESEKAMLHKEQALERLIIETCEAVKRLEKLHERELAT